MDLPMNRSRKILNPSPHFHANLAAQISSVKVAAVFSEAAVCVALSFFLLVGGEVGLASFPSFGDFYSDARDETQE